MATRHDSHGAYVLKSLEANKNVFVEKPLCLLESELDAIIDLQSKTNKAVMVGFNRRFSPLTTKLKKAVGNKDIEFVIEGNHMDANERFLRERKRITYYLTCNFFGVEDLFFIL